MANADKNLDQYFRDKLASHEVPPAKLAWERLDNRLSGQRKAAGYPWMRVAAIGLLLMGFGYVLFSLVRETEVENLDTTALVQEKPSLPNTAEEPEPTSMPKAEANTSVKPLEPDAQIPVETKPSAHTKQTEELPSEVLLAETPTYSPDETIIAAPEIQLPDLQMNEAVALNNPFEAQKEEPRAYRIIIKSNGFKEEPQKQNLIVGIENKVDKIGGLISKVEQGFADLQDAKDNLFDINAPKREKSPK